MIGVAIGADWSILAASGFLSTGALAGGAVAGAWPELSAGGASVRLLLPFFFAPLAAAGGSLTSATTGWGTGATGKFSSNIYQLARIPALSFLYLERAAALTMVRLSGPTEILWTSFSFRPWKRNNIARLIMIELKGGSRTCLTLL